MIFFLYLCGDDLKNMLNPTNMRKNKPQLQNILGHEMYVHN